jgi:hypothetical protein
VVGGILLIICTAQLLLGVHPVLKGLTLMVCSTTSSNLIPRLSGAQLILVAPDHFDARLVSVLVSWLDRDLSCNKFCGRLGGVICFGRFVQLRDPRRIASERVGFLRIDFILVFLMVDGSGVRIAPAWNGPYSNISSTSLFLYVVRNLNED